MGYDNVRSVLSLENSDNLSVVLDSIKNASLIYFTGGDQRRLMKALNEGGLKEAVIEAYQNGAVIAGTSAGAAIMSANIITGDEKRYPEKYYPTFRHLEAGNLDLAEGLGLLPNKFVIDQHFVKRSRYNRLLSAVIENPEWVGIGIEEGTAFVFSGDGTSRVSGEGQVILFSNHDDQTFTDGDLLKSREVTLSIYAPGDKFDL
jgi:cyanophycinase